MITDNALLLKALNGLDKKIRIAIIGLGAMGKGLLYQAKITPGIECVAVADRDPERCVKTLEELGLPFCFAANRSELNEAVSRSLVAVSDDGVLLAGGDQIDVVVEATSSIAAAAEFAVTALKSGKHLVLMNSEIDLIFGPYLAQMAEQNGVVYTSCAGDQYGVTKFLIDDLKLWGFELVMAGNIKGFLDRYANPTTIVPEADKRNLDYRMCASYTDGTKLNIEMAIIANAYGLRTPIPGMHGPRVAHVQEALSCFDYGRLWRDRVPFVDYILGAEPGGGVFAVGYCDNRYQQEMLAYYKMGPGPYYLFYRPYHLCHIEAMATIAHTVISGTALLRPDFGLVTNVYAYAKRDLHKGDRLDGIGGYNCYGMIENCADNQKSPGIPICLAEDLRVTADIAKDSKILLSAVKTQSERSDFQMYRQAERAG